LEQNNREVLGSFMVVRKIGRNEKPNTTQNNRKTPQKKTRKDQDLLTPGPTKKRTTLGESKKEGKKREKNHPGKKKGLYGYPEKEKTPGERKGDPASRRTRTS